MIRSVPFYLILSGAWAGFAVSSIVGAAPAVAAPAATRPAERPWLDREHAPRGEGWYPLFNGKDLAGWHRRPNHDRELSWKVKNGAMVNEVGEGHHGTDIVTDWVFDDFELYYEYRVPEGSNSGMYLRGRYEIQILADFGQEPSAGTNGGIWATAAPSRNVSRRPGEWQSVYTRIVGKTIETVVLNGVQIHENVKVPKPTGGHLDENVDQPGPVMIQGDHGSVEVRTVMIRPLSVPKVKFLDPNHAPEGPGWIGLCDGNDLDGWHKRPGHDRPLSWKVKDGVMINQLAEGQHGTDIVTDRKFDDFEIYYEYRIPAGSNSGLYLRGRYEIQILDDFGQKPSNASNGGLYSVVAPAKNASRPPGEWQCVRAGIAGRKVTVILNGVKTVDGFEVSRATGGQLDNDLGTPGPIMIQGDHGAIEVRNLMLRPTSKYGPDGQVIGRKAEDKSPQRPL
jgi:hypothetical protein